MTFEGGCYCGQVRYVAEGKPRLKAQCHCRECQYISGGAPNMFMLMPPEGLPLCERDAQDVHPQRSRSAGDARILRKLRHASHDPAAGPALVILKVGTLDDPSLFGLPQMAIYTLDKQPFHMIPEGVPAFERQPPR